MKVRLFKLLRFIKEGLDHEKVVERISLAIKNTRIFLTVPTMKYLLKSGRVSKTKGVIANLLNLKPIISIEQNGSIKPVAKTYSNKSALAKALALAAQYARSLNNPQFGVVHASAPENGRWLATRLEKQFNLKNTWVLDASPALGTHVGPGAAAIGVVGR